MLENIQTPVSVTLSFDHHLRHVSPTQIIWNSRTYPVLQLGLHHTYRQGRTLYHVFSVASTNLFFRLVLDTDTLFWQLTQISDGDPA